MNRRSGYTLLELLVAIPIFSLVAAAIGTSAVACLKLCRTAVVEAELSLRARELREKLLFHVRLPTSTAAYDGLLSAPSTSRVDTVAFTYEGEQLPLTSIGSGNRVRQSHRLILAGSDDNTYPMDDHAPHDTANERWLRPGGFYLDGEAYTAEQFITTVPVRETSRNALSRAQVYLVLAAKAEDGTVLGRREEAMIVPFLNATQTQFAPSQLHTYTQSGGTGR